ncbi:MAG: response regulator [Rhodothermales bacterium]|nr:response regulator [Rhodothermales bacterium]
MISKCEVLVVDDEDVVLGAVRRILSAHSIEHRVAGSAEQALDKIKESVPDLLLADIKLPGKSGLDLVTVCSDKFPSVVSVCMTGYANAEHVLLCLESGAVDFLPKPFTVEEMLSTLTRAGRLVGGEAIAKDVPADCFVLDGHTWARGEDDGTVTLGLIETFLQTVGPIKSLDIPAPNTMLRQGCDLTRVTATDGHVHRAWCAIGGRVEQSNDRLEGEPGIVSTDPYGEGWIACVMPTSIEEEVARLGSSDPQQSH